MSMSHGTRDYGRFDELAEEFVERYRRGERPPNWRPLPRTDADILNLT